MPVWVRALSRRSFLRYAVAGLAVPAVTTLLAACGGAGSETPASEPGTTGPGSATTASSPSPAEASPAAGQASPTFDIQPAEQTGGQLIEGSIADARTLASALASDTVSSAVIAMIFDGVMQTSPSDASPIGRLATAWEVSDDGVTYTFTLATGVTFHDGEPLTAQDVKFTYDLMLNSDVKSPVYATLNSRVATVDVVDPSRIIFTLKEPNAAFLVSNMAYGIMPAHLLEDVDPSALEQHDFSRGKKGVTVGSGPFMFEEWVKDDHVALVKNPGYWQGTPNLDRWILKVVPNQTVMAHQLKAEELDYGDIQPGHVAEMQSVPHLDLTIYDGFRFLFYVYQLDPAKTTLFQEPAVRQALFYALDRQTIVDRIAFGYATPAIGTMPKPSWAYHPEGIERRYDYDVAKARQLLDEAGWQPGADGIRAKDGKRLAFTVYTLAGNQLYEQYVTVFQEQWRQIGAECTPHLLEQNVFIEQMTSKHDFELAFFGFAWSVDPDQLTVWHSSAYEGGWNTGKYANPRVDELLEEGLRTSDQARRREIYTEMQNVLLEDLPAGVMDFTKGIVGLHRRVHNYFPNAINSRFNAHQWWVSQ